MYFLTPRKAAIFGVCCESIPRQVNFVIDEASDTGKGANTIVSMLHYFLAHHSLEETHLKLHADNCAGQNKKNTMLQYLMWRVLSGLHKTISLSFMITGHTKFSPDWWLRTAQTAVQGDIREQFAGHRAGGGGELKCKHLPARGYPGW